MALSRVGNKFTIKNPAFGKASAGEFSFEVPEGKLFKTRGGDIAGFKNNTLSMLNLGNPNKNQAYLQGLGIDFGDIPTIEEDLGAFIGDATLGDVRVNKQNVGENADFWKQFGIAGAGSTINPTGFQGSNAGLAPEEIARLETLAGRLPTVSDNKRAELTAMAGETEDNRITNALVDSGQLPENQREIFSQGTAPGGQTGIPEGATYISDPAELSGLTEEQIWRDPNSNRIYKLGAGGVAGGGTATSAGGGTPGATTGAPGTTGGGTGVGTGTAVDSNDAELQAMKDLLAEMKRQGEATFTKRDEFAKQIGLTQAQTRDAKARSDVLKLERDLDKLEDDINERISGKGVNEALRRRILQTEGRPIREQLADLQREAQIAGTGLSAKRQELSDLMNLYQDQQDNTIDQFEVALKIAERQSDLAKEAGQSERDIVESYIESYKDAGITLNDSLATAQEKLKSSKKYQNEIRLLGKSGAGTGTGLSYKLSTSIKNKLIGGGFIPSDIPAIESDVQQYGLDAVIEGITDANQLKAINDAFGRKDTTPKQKTLDQQLQALGWPAKAVRRFKQDQEAQHSSLDPNRWRAEHSDLFEEAGE